MGFSSYGSWAPERWLSTWGAWAELLRCVWDCLGPGIEPESPGRWILNHGTSREADCLQFYRSYKYHIVETIQYVTFLNWLLSLTNMLLKDPSPFLFFEIFETISKD